MTAPQWWSQPWIQWHYCPTGLLSSLHLLLSRKVSLSILHQHYLRWYKGLSKISGVALQPCGAVYGALWLGAGPWWRPRLWQAAPSPQSNAAPATGGCHIGHAGGKKGRVRHFGRGIHFTNHIKFKLEDNVRREGVREQWINEAAWVKREFWLITVVMKIEIWLFINEWSRLMVWNYSSKRSSGKEMSTIRDKHTKKQSL